MAYEILNKHTVLAYLIQHNLSHKFLGTDEEKEIEVTE